MGNQKKKSMISEASGAKKFHHTPTLTMSVAELRKNGMMAHLMDALSRGKEIGDYGRLVFVMVARYFLSEGQWSDNYCLIPTWMKRKRAR
jgi:hypothetical protein